VNLAITLTDAQVNEIAARAAELLADRQPTVSPWLDADGAAAHLATSRDRIYDLVQLGKLTPRRDGRRLVFKRSDLDGYLEGNG
jgi:excisionase family DNA binding protein